MLQASQRAPFVSQALHQVIAPRKLAQQGLEHEAFAELDMFDLVHRTHTADADQTQDAIARARNDFAVLELSKLGQLASSGARVLRTARSVEHIGEIPLRRARRWLWKLGHPSLSVRFGSELRARASSDPAEMMPEQMPMSANSRACFFTGSRIVQWPAL